MGFSLILGTIWEWEQEIFTKVSYVCHIVGNYAFSVCCSKTDIGKNISEVDWNMRQKNIFSSGYHLCSQLLFYLQQDLRYQCSVCYSAVCSIYGSPNENKPGTYGNMAILGAVGGTASPIALTGIIVGDLMAEMGIQGLESQIFLGVAVSNLICAAAMYFLLGGYKLRGTAEKSEKKTEKMDRNQWLSLSALFIMVILVVGFSFDVGLVCLSLALILVLLGAANEKTALKMIPWSVLILIAGVNVLMNITQKMGGIDLLSSILASFMSEKTASPLMGFTGGLMSWFSSANGVVFPTLIPTVPEIAAQVGGASVTQMVTAIVCSATVAGISPLSTGGSLIMASYAQETGCDEKEQQKLFGTLFGLSATVCCYCVYLNLLELWDLSVRRFYMREYATYIGVSQQKNEMQGKTVFMRL